ncbi:MAG TPA: lamin tail domain-containing protein [Kofleriaceae bacterium]|nr:lamin tail domain-containing protein [Kofleriaceae bacterium]
MASVLGVAACGDNVHVDPCQSMECPLPVPPKCDGDTLVVTAPATCTSSAGEPDCNYAETRTDCTANGMTCSAGACHPPSDPCAGVTCETPPDATCNGAVATTYDATGTCTGGTCDYAFHEEDCTTSNKICVDGACVDACTGVTCTTPPSPSCSGTVLTTYAQTGTCDGSTGSAVCSYAPSTMDCADNGDVCANGACVPPADPCASVTCDTPPADACTGNTLHDYPAIGTCDSSSGSAVCTYTPADTDCGATDEACQSGACVDPCIGVTCDTPPANDCTAGVFTTYAQAGTCTSPNGVQTCTYAPTQTSCVAQNEACDTTNGCFDPCVGFACTTPPAPTCTGDTLTTFASSGTCSSPAGVPGCTYAPTTTDCTLTGDVCSNGACVPPADPCSTTTCDTPPADDCTGNTRHVYPATGTCASTSGSAVCTYAPTDTDCTTLDRTCSAGACVDPCVGFACDTPPASTCAGSTATTYPATGTCSSPGGVPACDYTPTTTDCATLDEACSGGACVDPCATTTCDTPPAAACTGNTLTTYPATGSCSSPGGVPDCTYAPTTLDCTTQDKICSNGACVDPCIGFTCDTPPANTCSGMTATQYPATGTCSAPGGVPGCTYTPTTTDCAATDQACVGGACTDPCSGVTCNTPPAASCVGTVAHTFAANGTCSSPGGVEECDYTETTTDCALTGQTCDAGACTGPSLFCRVQFPDSITDVPTTTQTVYGRIYVQGVTDQTGGNDPNVDVAVELGLGTGTDPTAYTYTAAIPNPTYGPGSPGYEANNDEYQGTFVVPNAPGTTQHYAYRLSNDAGATWMYCDTGTTGSSDGFTAPGDLNIAAPYFSEYIEGSSNNKAVEIYNPGSIAFPLTGCSIKVYLNGSSTASSTFALTGTSIAAGDVYVFCQASYALADKTECDQTTTSTSVWNGDDAVQLVCGTTTYDVIGQIGFRPTNEWGTGLTSTMDNTLLRACTAFAGDSDGSNVFDPAADWQGYATDSHFLGARNCPLP